MSLLVLELDRTAPGRSEWRGGGDSAEAGGKKSIQVSGASNSGNWTATVRVYGSNDGRFPILLYEFDISDSVPSEAGEITFRWEQFCFEIVASTGSATRVSAVMSV
jgi:hypothetical protein